MDVQNIPSDINDLMVHFEMLPVTNDVDLYFQVYDNTGALDVASGHYAWSNGAVSNATTLGSSVVGSSSVSSGNTTAIILNYAQTNNRVNQGAPISGHLHCYNIRNTGLYKRINYACNYLTGVGSAWMGMTGNGIRVSAGLITGFRLVFAPGNVAAGSTLAVWGAP
jgi:hypothetical protein